MNDAGGQMSDFEFTLTLNAPSAGGGGGCYRTIIAPQSYEARLEAASEEVARMVREAPKGAFISVDKCEDGSILAGGDPILRVTVTTELR